MACTSINLQEVQLIATELQSASLWYLELNVNQVQQKLIYCKVWKRH